MLSSFSVQRREVFLFFSDPCTTPTALMLSPPACVCAKDKVRDLMDTSSGALQVVGDKSNVRIIGLCAVQWPVGDGVWGGVVGLEGVGVATGV